MQTEVFDLLQGGIFRLRRVFVIPHYAVSRVLAMHANLMRPASFRHSLKQGSPLEALLHSEAGQRRLATIAHPNNALTIAKGIFL